MLELHALPVLPRPRGASQPGCQFPAHKVALLSVELWPHDLAPSCLRPLRPFSTLLALLILMAGPGTIDLAGSLLGWVSSGPSFCSCDCCTVSAVCTSSSQVSLALQCRSPETDAIRNDAYFGCHNGSHSRRVPGQSVGPNYSRVW